MTKKKTTTKKPRAPKKPTKPKADWPSECPHKNFFWCKTPKDCPTCYYNKDIKPPPGSPWFYSNKKFVTESLKTLDDIRMGRGLLPGGRRFSWKHARNKKQEEE